MSNETTKDQVRRLIAGIAPCYEKRPDLIKDDDYCFGFMVQVVDLAIAEEREANKEACAAVHEKFVREHRTHADTLRASGARACVVALEYRCQQKTR